MWKEICLVPHHIEFVSQLNDDLTEEDVLFQLGVLSNEYPFIWDREFLRLFAQRIREARRYYSEGKFTEIPEEFKKDDYICQACGNLIEGRCKLEKPGL